ncbi:hypothetical protein ACVWZR_001084 [Bradyrhizobium sp. i1.3.1]
MRDLAVVNTPEPCASVRRVAVRVARLQLPVEPDVMELLAIFPNQAAFAGCEVEHVDIVPARVAIVEADCNLVRNHVRPVRRHRSDIGKGREIPEL